MPIIQVEELDLNINSRDLFLDVKLVSIDINDAFGRDESSGFINENDFTGKQTFNIGFFKEGAGFGITNIKITTNTSLQPLAEIEFKDLYGKTVFGENDDNINYKALFAWPPPKFELTFKGYLGKPVTWIISMKSISTSYNPQDGSYIIKTVFVPNQWGMFGDIPFLYLLAAKKLRADALGLRRSSGQQMNEDEYKRKSQSIIDLMYIGKKIENKKEQKTKEYDKIVESLSSLKRDPLGGIIGGFLSIGGDSEIKSEVSDKGEIIGFEKLKVKLPPDKVYEGSEEDIMLYLRTLPLHYRNIENYRIKIATLGGNDGLLTTSNPNDSQIQKLKETSKLLDGKIDKNLELIKTAIKAKIFLNNSEEIKKLTISEIFNQISKDTAYIMGYILDAGEQGYFNHQKEREEAEKNNKIIGLYYPLQFEPTSQDEENKDSSIQVPAKGYGTEEFEKAFIENFITAISYGITQNRVLQEENDNPIDDKIIHRVNNIELISKNPFLNKTDWKEIASIIMKRAGIAGYLTQSDDPNNPGDYGDDYLLFPSGRANSPEQIRQLAKNDVNNITTQILSQLDNESLEELKDFCIFWMNAISDTTGNTSNDVAFSDLKWFGGNAKLSGEDEYSLNRKIVILNPGISSLANNSSTLKLISSKWSVSNRIFSANSDVALLLKQQGVLNTSKNEIDLTSGKGALYKDAGFKAYTIEQYLEKFIGPNYIFNGRSTAQAKNGVSALKPTLNSTSSFYDTKSFIIHYNGLCFTHCVSDNLSSVISEVTNTNIGTTYVNLLTGDAFSNPIQTFNTYTGGLSKYEWLIFSEKVDTQLINEFQPTINKTDSELNNLSEEKKQESAESLKPKGIVKITSLTVPVNNSEPQGEKKIHPGIDFINLYANSNQLLDFNWCKSQKILPGKRNVVIENKTDVLNKPIPAVLRQDLTGNINFNRTIIDTPTVDYKKINIKENQISLVAYAQTWSDLDDPTPTGGLFDDNDFSLSSRVFLRQFCSDLKNSIFKIQDETNRVFSQILGKGGDYQDLMYQQMNTLFHQWQTLAAPKGTRLNQPNNPSTLSPNVANVLQDIFSKTHNSKCSDIPKINNGQDEGGGFRYDYPLQKIGDTKINVADSLINIESLYNANASTTVLNIYQQLCEKNNFMFFPIAGNAKYCSINDIFKPYSNFNNPSIGNFFQVLFQPTPENRAFNTSNEKISKIDREKFTVDAFGVTFGSVKNKIITNVTFETDESKVNAESIVNLQRIVDNENNNKSVTTDCSLLSVYEGRSYTAKLETLGNAQISPLQYFYIKNNSIFDGLYQISKVNHNITPNDMETDFEGVRLRCTSSGYGGVVPFTLQDYKNAVNVIKEAPLESDISKQDVSKFEAMARPEIPESGSIEGSDVFSGMQDGNVASTNVTSGSVVSSGQVQIPKEVSAYFGNTSKFLTADSRKPITDNSTSRGNISKAQLIQNLNEFLEDRWKPFAVFMSANYPELKGKIDINSAIRCSIIADSSAGSQHLLGQAVDFGPYGDKFSKLNTNFIIFNALMQFHRVNDLDFDQILFETKPPSSVWIHWSYSRAKTPGIYNNRLRFYNGSTARSVSMNNGRNKKENIVAATGDMPDKSFSKKFVGANTFEGT